MKFSCDVESCSDNAVTFCCDLEIGDQSSWRDAHQQLGPNNISD